MIYARIQRPGLGWNPGHHSHHPRQYEPGVTYWHGESGDWEELPGLAAFPLTPRDAARAIFGLDFVLADASRWPNLMDWEAEGVDEVWRSDVEGEYDVFVFTGEMLQTLPDGVVVQPTPVRNEALIAWFLDHADELLSDPDVREELSWMDGETDDERIRDMVQGSEWEQEESGLLIAIPAPEDARILW